MKNAKAGAESVVIVALGDSKTETANPNATIAPSRMAWTAIVNEELSTYTGHQVFDVPFSYNSGGGVALMPSMTKTGTDSPGNVGTDTMRQRVISSGGSLAYYFPTGLDHLGFTLCSAPGVSGSFGCSVYTGDVTSTIPTYGTTTNRVAHLATDPTKYASSYSWDGGWGQTANITMDANGVQFGKANNIFFVPSGFEAMSAGVSSGAGCTVVFYAGNTPVGCGRFVGKVGGTTFNDKYAVCVNEGHYGEARDMYVDGTSSPTSTYYGNTYGLFRFWNNALRWLKKYQPWQRNPSSPTTVDLGRNMAGDNAIVTYSEYTNVGSTVDTFGWSSTHPDSGEIAAAVGRVQSLVQQAATEGVPFVFFELTPITEYSAYNDYMEAMKAMIEAEPNGVWASYPTFLADQYGVSVATMRTRTGYKKYLSSARVVSADTSDLHASAQETQALGRFFAFCLTYQG
ncbi:MAG: hypothetical protein JST51_11635 [Armatimonadetes bacterium]|nr:hypothetical protein [Armatimonadota bacterium]